MTLQELLSEAKKLTVKDQIYLATQLLQGTELQAQPSGVLAIEKVRSPGLNSGQCIMAKDFDKPLPDSFWLGDK
ncbi:MAG: hypothetical protein AAGD25_03295 [Cyanobacteria bacterium P01_F01_bin.150]